MSFCLLSSDSGSSYILIMKYLQVASLYTKGCYDVNCKVVCLVVSSLNILNIVQSAPSEQFSRQYLQIPEPSPHQHLQPYLRYNKKKVTGELNHNTNKIFKQKSTNSMLHIHILCQNTTINTRSFNSHQTILTF